MIRDDNAAPKQDSAGADPVVDPLSRWRVLGVVSAALIVVLIPLAAFRHSGRAGPAGVGEAGASFVGREQCRGCHQQAYEAWLGSHHDDAMVEASPETVLGDFGGAVFDDGRMRARFFRRGEDYFVETPGPDGQTREYEIAYVFGVEPLQQYLIPFEGGRYQSFTVAWNTDQGAWFNLYPDRDIPPSDWLHWTRAAQTWNGMCAECHSTNLRKGYDPESRTFQTTWSEIDVSCEACHGPGSRHVAWAVIPPMARPPRGDYGLVVPTSGLTGARQVELCAPCHSRRSELGDYDHRGGALLDRLLPAILDEGLYHPDGQILEEVYVYGSFVQSKMYRNDVRCTDCHDPHTLDLKEQGNALCGQCHRADVYDGPGHHFHEKTHEGRPSEGALCVKCHMPEQAYMVIDWRADHSLRVPRPDLTRRIGTPNACAQSGCHDDKPLAWQLDSYERWYGTARKPHYGTILAAGREARPEARPQLVQLAGDVLYPAIVRATALSLLRSYPEAEAAPAFASALADDDALLRYTAAMSVNAGTPERLVEWLAPLLEDPVRAVRTQAASRLSGTPEVLLKPYQARALEAATAEFVEAMRYSLDFAFAAHNLGNLHARLGQAEEAEAHYRSAIEIDDLFVPAKVNLATLYNSLGRNAEAEALLRQVLEAYPEMHDVAYSLGLLLAEMKSPTEAVRYLERAARGLPGRARFHYNLGLLRQQMGQGDEAESALRQALELEPDSLEYQYGLAQYYVRTGALRAALEVAERMTTTHPDSPVGRDLKAQLEAAIRAPGRP